MKNVKSCKYFKKMKCDKKPTIIGHLNSSQEAFYNSPNGCFDKKKYLLYLALFFMTTIIVEVKRLDL